MPPAESLGPISLALAIAVGLIAAALGLRQWSEWNHRAPALVDEDRGYFYWQDLRRGIGVIVMVILAVGVGLGARLKPFVVDPSYEPQVVSAVRVLAGSRVEPLIARHANPLFIRVWLCLITLILVLLALALWDSMATRRYARRQRQSLVRERNEMLRDTLLQSGTDRDWLPDDPEQDES
jgi:hypothetical protein